jgi:uncharacterized membrane protein YphA (DoxX/SURF4 family)
VNFEYILVEFCRWLLVYCLALGAFSKLMGFTEFSQNLADGFKISHKINRQISAAIIIIEAATATCLIILPGYSVLFFAVCLVLFTSFTAVLIWALHQERNIACHCFGHVDGNISTLDVWRNGLLMLACVSGMVFSAPDSDYAFFTDFNLFTEFALFTDSAQFNGAPHSRYLITLLPLPCLLLIVHFKEAVNLLRYKGSF